MNITEICTYLRNYFVPADKRENRFYIHSGTFTVKDGKIFPVEFLKENQYFRVVGSALNDGVYCNCTNDLKTLKNETFDGAVHEMAVPPAFLKLCKDIEAWREKNESTESTNMSPFVSESFGGYSYSKSGNRTNSGNSGNAVTWQNQFANRLNTWRKI